MKVAKMTPAQWAEYQKTGVWPADVQISELDTATMSSTERTRAVAASSLTPNDFKNINDMIVDLIHAVSDTKNEPTETMAVIGRFAHNMYAIGYSFALGDVADRLAYATDEIELLQVERDEFQAKRVSSRGGMN